jgi:hypothetical protein
MKILSVVVFIIIQLAGCASQSELQTLADSRDNVVRYQTEMQSQPLFTIKCGKDGCQGLDFAYTPARVGVVVPNVKGTNDVIVGVAPAIASSVTWLGGAFAATRIVDDIMTSAGGGNTNTHNTTSINGDDNQFSSTSNLNKNDSHNVTGETTDRHDTIDSHDAVSKPVVVKPSFVRPSVVKPEIVIVTP